MYPLVNVYYSKLPVINQCSENTSCEFLQIWQARLLAWLAEAKSENTSYRSQKLFVQIFKNTVFPFLFAKRYATGRIRPGMSSGRNRCFFYLPSGWPAVRLVVDCSGGPQNSGTLVYFTKLHCRCCFSLVLGRTWSSDRQQVAAAATQHLNSNVCIFQVRLI